ncbi:MAG: hypothetical protein Q8K00_14730 [Syntrophales bacterium]|nr:hypothetical protein [Syntrophales bacterium]
MADAVRFGAVKANAGRLGNKGNKVMETKDTLRNRGKRSVLTGGLILITLGILIILSKMGVWGFGRSWPLLLIIIAVGTLGQQIDDLKGWIIGCVGMIFLVSENLEVKIYAIATFLLPALLILVGISILMKHFKR